MFAICRVNSISGAVKYLTEKQGWSRFPNRAFLFGSSFDADDFLSFAFPFSPPLPFYYEVREIRSASKD